MANFILSPSMALPIPVVGIDNGPDYAFNINSSLTLIDGHDHSSGYGVQIKPSGININADLTFNDNNATSLRTVRFQPQVSAPVGATDLGALCEIGVDLYYIDGSGNIVRITQSGGVAGSPGSISNLTSPASASYVAGSSTFVWQSAASKAANIDAGSYLLRNLSPNSTFALTLSPPAGMGANFTITLPNLPPSNSFMTINNSGSIGTVTGISGSDIFAGTITGNNIASQTITNNLLAPVNGSVTGSANNSNTSSTTLQFTGMTLTLVNLVGRPIMMGLQSFDNSAGYVSIAVASGTPQSFTWSGNVVFVKDGNPIASNQIGGRITSSFSDLTSILTEIPLTAFNFIDFFPSSSSHTYSVFIQIINSGGTGTSYQIVLNNARFFAFEI